MWWTRSGGSCEVCVCVISGIWDGVSGLVGLAWRALGEFYIDLFAYVYMKYSKADVFFLNFLLLPSCRVIRSSSDRFGLWLLLVFLQYRHESHVNIAIITTVFYKVYSRNSITQKE